MCEIDWGAIAEWLSAIGTMGAVIVALHLARSDRHDQQLREKHEAQVIAGLLDTDLVTIKVQADIFAWAVDEDRSAGLLGTLLATEDHLRKRIASQAMSFPTATLESVIGRLHVLPAPASGALLRLVAAVRELRLAASTLTHMDGGQASEDMPQFLPKLQEQAADLQQKAEDAIAACRKVAGAE